MWTTRRLMQLPGARYILALWIAFVLLEALWSYRRFADIAARQISVPGKITDYDGWNHCRWHYRFSWHRHTIEGGTSACFGTDGATSPYELGQHVTVYLDPAHPATNSLDSFADQAEARRGVSPFLLAGGGVVAGLLLLQFAYARLRGRRPGP